MTSFGNAASSHSGLIPLKTAYKKRGELLWAIASKKNFINLHSAAFVTVFAPNLVHAYNFRTKSGEKLVIYLSGTKMSYTEGSFATRNKTYINITTIYVTRMG